MIQTLFLTIMLGSQPMQTPPVFQGGAENFDNITADACALGRPMYLVKLITVKNKKNSQESSGNIRQIAKIDVIKIISSVPVEKKPQIVVNQYSENLSSDTDIVLKENEVWLLVTPSEKEMDHGDRSISTFDVRKYKKYSMEKSRWNRHFNERDSYQLIDFDVLLDRLEATCRRRSQLMG